MFQSNIEDSIRRVIVPMARRNCFGENVTEERGVVYILRCSWRIEKGKGFCLGEHGLRKVKCCSDGVELR